MADLDLSITLRVAPPLRFFLLPVLRDFASIPYTLRRRASIKDVVESFGIPHTEVGQLRVHGVPVSFACIVEDGAVIEVFPPAIPFDVLTPAFLRPHPLPVHRFVADVNVGRLARLLRMAGFDTLFRNDFTDEALAAAAADEGRILLTKDRLLLRRRLVEFGRYVRADAPYVQLAEILDFFGLRPWLEPFSRCMACNGVLQAVAKEAIVDRLQPLTRRYFDIFRACPGCGRIFWHGSHREKMEKLLDILGV